MLSVPNVATPREAATVLVPDSVAPLAPVPGVIATVTVPVNAVSALPNASCAATCTAGASVEPVGVVAGCTVKASLVAGPPVIANAALVAAGRAEAVAVRE